MKSFGSLPDFKPESGHILICASGNCLWEDLYTLAIPLKWQQEFDIMAVNDAGMHIPHRLKHWYSNDYTMLVRWRKSRRPRFKTADDAPVTENEQIQMHSCFPCPGAIVWPWHGGGTSTLNAVFTALALGYDKITICGAPLNNEPHYFDPPHTKTNFERSGGWRTWQDARDRHFNGKVKAVSGNTKIILEGNDIA